MSRLMPLVPSLDVGKLRAALAPLARVVADPRSFSGWLFLAESMMFAGMGFIACSLVRRGRSALATYFVLAAAIVVGQLPIVARQLTAEMLLGSAAGLVATALFCRWPTSVRASVAFFLCFSSFCITESVTTHAGGATYPFNWIPFAVNLDNTLGGIESLLELVSLSAALAWCVRTGATEPRTRWSGWTAGSLIAIGTLALELNQRKISGRIGDITTPLVMTIAWIVSLRFATTADPGRAENNDTALTPPRFAMRSASVGTTTPKVPYWVLSWALVAGVIWAVGQLPAVPYNVRELLYRDHPIRSAVMLAFALALTLGVPAWLIVWTTRRPWIWMLAPATLVANALVAWWVVVNAVASRNIHDIVGSPVLGWPGETETGLRFVALHGTIAFLVSWAVLVAMIAYRRSTMALVARWFVLTMPLAWISHWTIVERAATDNLTELMRDGGSLTASVLLSLAAVLSFLAGSLIAGSIANGRKRGVALALAVASSVGAFVLLNAGTEPALLKYGKVFSALQFLLSPDRAHYVGQGELIARYALAQLLLVGAVVLLQLPAWFAVAGHLPRPDGTAEQLDTRARTEQQP